MKLPTRWLDAGLDPETAPPGLLHQARLVSATSASLAALAGAFALGGALCGVRSLGWLAGVLCAGGLLNLALLRVAFARIRRELESLPRLANDRVVELAFHDALTGLPNRQHFQERLGEALYAASRHGRSAGLLFLDLDGFKGVNDSLGHGAGDRLLREVGWRLRKCVRLTDTVGRHDGDESAVSRLGGDEFTVLLGELAEPVGAAAVAQRILEALSRPIEIDGCEVFVGASIGIAICPEDGADAETLLRCADQAMYEAKSRGRNNFQFYTEALSLAARRKVLVEGRLRRALKEGGLELHYQPMRRVSTGRLAAAEALVRWHDAELGPVSPDEFVPVAEQTGLVTALGDWVIRTAALQLRDWCEAGYRPIRLAVNVSSRHLRHHSLVETVSRTLEESGVSPGLFELEITESSIMTDDPVTCSALRALSDLGVSLALDDFGTGFSSLAHLRILPFDRLKIDRSFVSGVANRADERAVTASVIQLAHSLGMQASAEGVESEEHLAFLREHDCDEVQGYLFSPPVPASEFERLLERDKPDGE